MRKLNLLVSLSLLVGALLLPAAVLAAPPECKIVGSTISGIYDNLQAAVDAASPGDTLKLRGTCVGPTVIAKDLTIEGKSNPAFGTATLDAQGAAGATLKISSGNVTLEGLTITGGTGWGPAPGLVLGGGGIFAGFCSTCTVTLIDSIVTGNTVAGSNAGGGGIMAFGATVILNNSTVSGNTATVGGGIVGSCGLGGSLTLNNSIVSNNHATSLGISGGGGMFTQGCTATLNDSTVSHNSSAAYGGGLAPFNGALFLNNSTVSDNSAVVSGGGLYTINNPVTLDATSSISNNTPDDCAGNTCP